MIWTVTQIMPSIFPKRRRVEMTREDGHNKTTIIMNELDAAVGDQYTLEGNRFMPILPKTIIEVEL